MLGRNQLDLVHSSRPNQHKFGRQILQRIELGSPYEDKGLVFCGPLGSPFNPMMVTFGSEDQEGWIR